MESYGGESREIEEVTAGKAVILNVKAEIGWENMAARHEQGGKSDSPLRWKGIFKLSQL